MSLAKLLLRVNVMKAKVKVDASVKFKTEGLSVQLSFGKFDVVYV